VGWFIILKQDRWGWIDLSVRI